MKADPAPPSHTPRSPSPAVGPAWRRTPPQRSPPRTPAWGTAAHCRGTRLAPASRGWLRGKGGGEATLTRACRVCRGVCKPWMLAWAWMHVRTCPRVERASLCERGDVLLVDTNNVCVQIMHIAHQGEGVATALPSGSASPLGAASRGPPSCAATRWWRRG